MTDPEPAEVKRSWMDFSRWAKGLRVAKGLVAMVFKDDDTWVLKILGYTG